MHDKNQNDPLFFWVKNDEKYPFLAPLAQDMLVIPASSTPIEQIFSIAGYSTSSRRNILAGSNLEHEILLKSKKSYTFN